MSEQAPIVSLDFDSAELLASHPPKLRHPNKRVVFETLCPAGQCAGSAMHYSRWWAMSLPPEPQRSKPFDVLVREDVYDYAPIDPTPRSIEWHVNFADPQLFVAYGTGLFAQDEIQVAEHPALASLREALLASNEKAVTVLGGIPTPVLVRGVPRCGFVLMDANASEGRPHGLYGNRFGAADAETIRRATRRTEPPTVSNIIAIAAPQGGPGRYRWDEIDFILSTAYTGFRAAAIESRNAAGENAMTTVHTGFWGCGAFGGNRTLMPLAQLIAAHWAGIDRFVFHSVTRDGTDAFAAARKRFDEILGRRPLQPRQLIDRLVEAGFAWGVSDRN